jgi:carbamoyl-phosphate synthase large subunit
MSEPALVTGGAGVIGRALLDLLVREGVPVRCIDIQPPPAWLHPQVEYVQADLRDLDDSAFSSFAPTTIYHLAATFERSEEAPEFWRENAEHNVRLSQRVLAAAERCTGLRRLVFASSYLVYDSALYLLAEPPSGAVLLDERSAIRPRNVCGAAKLLHELELELAGSAPSAGFTSVSARIYRVYGRGSRDVVSRWARAALAGEPIEVYGAESCFDYVFADDVARALRLLARSDVTGPVNVATGAPRRVVDIVELLRTLVPRLEVRQSAVRAAQFEASAADVSRLREAVGWVPETTLEEGVATLLEHERGAREAGTVSRRIVAPPRIGVLVTSASRKTPLIRAFRETFRALAVDGCVWAGDSDARCAAAFEADAFWRMPPLAELADDELVRHCVDNGIRLVVPTRDGELARFAALAPALQQAGVRVAVSAPETVALCDDKLAYAELCATAGLAPIPTAAAPIDVEARRLVVKERRGAGSRGIALDVSPAEAAAFAAGFTEPVFQPFVEGRELSVDLFARADGRVLGAVARTRDLVVDGESQVTTAVDAPELVAECTLLAAQLGIRGHAVFQAIDTGSGHAHVECNPRVGGASALAFAAGLRTPEYLVREALGEVPGPASALVSGLRLVRRPVDRVLFP